MQIIAHCLFSKIKRSKHCKEIRSFAHKTKEYIMQYRV